MTSEAAEDYLKVIYELQKGDVPVTTSAIASQIGVSPASVSNMLKRLADMGLVEYTRYRGVVLTPAGEEAALEVIRHHRLIETFLTVVLGMPWDQVHEEAHRLEHVISEELEERIAAALNHPTVDPHGAPIPSRDGTIEELACVPLVTLSPEQKAVVRRVQDEDSAMLRYLAELGLVPDAVVEVVERAPFDGPIHVKVGDRVHVIGRRLAQEIFVTVLPSQE